MKTRILEYLPFIILPVATGLLVAFVIWLSRKSLATKAGFAYIALSFCMIPLVFVHHYRLDVAIEATRGEWIPGFLPGECLILRWLGEIARILIFFPIVLWALSYRYSALSRRSVLFTFAFIDVLFLVWYATVAGLNLSLRMPHH